MGAAAGAAAGAEASDASPMRAISVPTSTVSSSGTRISRRTPATGDGTSESTLSVDTSTMGSSSSTVSPTCLSHVVTVPSVTDSPRAGMVTDVAMCVLLIKLYQLWTWRGLPASAIAASPSDSFWLGCAWGFVAM